MGSGIQQHLFVGEQGGASSGVKEKNFFIFGESAFADVIDQACHPFSGIDGIEQDSFGFRQEMNGFQGSFVGNPCLLYTSPSPRDGLLSRMQYSA